MRARGLFLGLLRHGTVSYTHLDVYKRQAYARIVLAERILSVGFQMGSKPPTMPKRSLCADNLFLLGELLQGAAEYLSRCQETLEDEQGQMVELACEQIPQLKQMVETLDRKLKELEGHLRKKGSSCLLYTSRCV